ncbi:hypothetical protein L1987_33049 [Smallanthus sonchifolius]|uniref:Uncharacterized protein n=1 Tax=Smallanthus sonchifolius TaxID=185202 RepID=A0ACB9HRC8_9ASTR|nr:hypothetical protein L1987_33049 [Smallanthus sonchifolius]
MRTTIQRFGVRCVGNPTTLKIVQILKRYPTEQQDDPFQVQESKVVTPTSLVGSSDSKEQEPSSFTSMDQLEVRLDDSEEMVTTSLQSLHDFSEGLESGVPITLETTLYEEPDCETNIQKEIMQEEVFTNKQMTMVRPLSCNSDS